MHLSGGISHLFLKMLPMTINLQEEIERIAIQIVEKYKPDKIILFGSAARGEWSSDRNADFLMIKKETPYYGRDRIREPSRLIDRQFPVDLLIYRSDEFDNRIQMGDPFLKTIFKEGKVLHG
jgi:predicted nucleotidyltransferase